MFKNEQIRKKKLVLDFNLAASRAIRYKSSLVPRCGLSAAIAGRCQYIISQIIDYSFSNKRICIDVFEDLKICGCGSVVALSKAKSSPWFVSSRNKRNYREDIIKFGS
jgi:hypothetical protein